MNWEMVIGLEIHVQLKTKSKLFSNSPTTYGAMPNTQASFIDIALPGVLPVLNKKVIDLAVRFGLAVDATISKNSFFARKNYFYPDLPKGYQISQSDNPIIQNGHIDIKTSKGLKTIRIERAHLEEDAGKSVHDFIDDRTGIDFNRVGTPLLEIVTKPDFRSSEEVITFLKYLHQLVRYLDISDGNMQEGSFRCDVNLSMKPKDSNVLGRRAELKNINSFRFIENAIDYEKKRQLKVLESGAKVLQETRLYDSLQNKTRSMRSKEEAYDYRYFPDPDLLPILLADEQIAEIAADMPVDLKDKKEVYLADLDEQEVEFLCTDIQVMTYFDRLSGIVGRRIAFNWISGELMALLNRHNIDFHPTIVPIEALSELIKHTLDDTISNQSARVILDAYYNTPQSMTEIIEKLGLRQSNDTDEIEILADRIIAENPAQVAQYQAGKTKLLGFFVGQIMKNSTEKLNPKQINEIVLKKLNA
ncbi:MAG: Asp-tRNA(Asn)/Glu-tRNA(Gln) amidotransferase subunit GatB [Francisellaceae bacterium]